MSGFWKKKQTLYALLILLISWVFFGLYLWYISSSDKRELPRTKKLRRENAELVMRSQILDHQLDIYSSALQMIGVRDEEIYRSIFGLASIPQEVRESGLAGDKRYEEVDEQDRSGKVKELRRRSDMLLKKAYVQSKSFDEIELMLKTADQMATSIPAISPVLPDKGMFHISSPFGYRVHPFLKYRAFHNGMDFAMNPGNPVYATGDGVVESVKIEMRGYGRQVVIDHGFGYKTRYAHLKTIIVSEGMKVKRGEQIATSGNTGRSSGPHLHYEVLYKGKYVNPFHYFDWDISVEQYQDMVQKANDSEDDGFFIHPMHRKHNTK